MTSSNSFSGHLPDRRIAGDLWCYTVDAAERSVLAASTLSSEATLHRRTAFGQRPACRLSSSPRTTLQFTRLRAMARPRAAALGDDGAARG